MSIIYYLLVSLFRWDMKWILKLSSMWGITRLFLVLIVCATLMFDGYYLYDKITHVQRINTELKRAEPCILDLGYTVDSRLNWGLVRKLKQSEWSLRENTDELCRRASVKRLDQAYIEVLGVSRDLLIKDPINVTLPNGKTINSIPRETTEEQIKEIAIRAGLAKKSDFNNGRKIKIVEVNPFDQFDTHQ